MIAKEKKPFRTKWIFNEGYRHYKSKEAEKQALTINKDEVSKMPKGMSFEKLDKIISKRSQQC